MFRVSDFAFEFSFDIIPFRAGKSGGMVRHSDMRIVVIVLLVALDTLVRAGTPRDAGFKDTLLENGLAQPTSMAWAPDGSNRLFVTLKEQGLRIVRDGELQSAPFATFAQLHSAGECGVLGLCFDADYVRNRFVYVFVTVSPSEQRIFRFTDVNSVGAARTTIVAGLPTAGTIHNGGAIGVGHDGKLYWAIGDNGQKRGVDAELRTLASKVGRANADGSVPDNNPFHDGPGPRQDLIWATGFRNPFSMTFQPRTGRLWLNVVGSTSSGQTSPNSGPGYEQVFALAPGDDGGYDDYEGNQPAGVRYLAPFARRLAAPVIQYKTERGANPAQFRNIVQSRVNQSAIIVETDGPHPYRVGQAVIISGTSRFDGTFVVQERLSSTAFMLAGVAADRESEAGGAVRPLVQGSCISGGSFYESSAFPMGYRGDFFYCDFTGGGIMRARIDQANQVIGVQQFIADARSPVDIAVGPDGALYYAEFSSGSVRRVAWSGAPPPEIVVTPAVFNIIEGGAGTFSVRLGRAPGEEMLLNVRRASGDADLDVESGASLLFDQENWQQPQTVTIRAQDDADLERDEATFDLSSPGIPPETVRVSASDNTERAPLLSLSVVEVREGGEATFDVTLANPPRRPVTFAIQKTSRNSAVRVVKSAPLIFTPENFAEPRTVRLIADEDGNNRNESLQLTIRARGYSARRVTLVVQDND